jgi:Tol biopolymer transport system component
MKNGLTVTRHPISMFALVVSVLSTLLVSITPEARATFPGRNGRIAFSSDRGGDFEIYTIRPRGGGLIQVTDAPGNSIFSDWTPDGRRLVFDSDRVTRGCSEQACNVEIFIANANGSGVRRLTHSPSFDGNPVVSPDGTRIAFESDRDGDPEIYTMRLDGTNVRQVTNNDWFDFVPDWSPDGRRLAFQSDAGRGFEHSAVFTIRPDGSNRRRVTPWRLKAGAVDWAPGGVRLAFASNAVVPEPSAIYTIKADGSELRRVSTLARGESHFFPTWSPDGRRIAFTRDRDDRVDVFVMGRRGRNLSRVTRTPAFELGPDWGPLRG